MRSHCTLRRQVLAVDSRFMVFEFIYGMVLRKAQVELVQSFTAALANGDSHCEQMIMVSQEARGHRSKNNCSLRR
jgi:hypothetical protein